WFTSDKMAVVKKVHQYLESLPETGKVVSLATLLKIAEDLNDGKPLDNFKLALLYSEIPAKFKKSLNPYVSVEHNQVRFLVRVRDSDKSLQRNKLLQQIRRDMTGKLGIKPEHFKLSGMLVLYNNMVRSLFHSQILTLGFVVLALMGMFLIKKSNSQILIIIFWCVLWS
ncbi:hypothetical protein LCGC14_2748370, partial [marine sediment metagenome]